MFPMLFTIAALAQTASASPEARADAPQVRQTVEKSLALLEKEGLEWETNRCVSCHHGPWMMWSGYEAKKGGFTVNEKSLEQVRAKALQAYLKHPKLKPTSRDVHTELSINVIYLTFGMGAAGEPDAETAKFFDKAAAHLLEQQNEDGSWKVCIKKSIDGRIVDVTDSKAKATPHTTFLMPPLIDSDDVTTMWALLALSYREPSGISKEALDKSKEKALKFLSDHPSSDTLLSLVLRIMLNQRLGKADVVQSHVKELLALQKEDGGWSQTKKLKSDALGTGQALVALTTAGVTAKDTAVTKARGYLIKNQKPDGSWFVNSRAYQAPKFSSYMGTAWATLGLVRTLPESKEADAAPTPEQLRQSVKRCLVFLERDAKAWWYDKPVVAEKDKRPVVVGPRKQKACASCHHVPMAVWSLTEAKNHGFAVNAKVLDEMLDWTFPPYVNHPELKPAVQDNFGNSKVSLNTIYLSFAAAADPSPAEKALQAMKKFAAHLIDKQEADGTWKAGRTGYEPPIGDITEVLTMQALLVLATAHDKGLVDADQWARCRDRALESLRKTKLSDRHQSLAMNVLVRQRFGKPEEVQTLVKQLLAQQNADGGWSQLKELPSDAMATGQTLYVLARVGVKDQTAAIERAQGFLVRTQTQDGGWWVTSREKGRKGVASSYYGSGWATLGLIRTLPQGQPGVKTALPEKAESKTAKPEKKP